MSFQLNWFRSFEAAARLHSFTAAALELNLSQAAISQQIKLLEFHSGAPLFLRLARGVSLTDAGRRMYVDVAAALGLLEKSVKRDDTTASRTLELTCNNSFAMGWLVSRLPDFLSTNADISLKLSTVLWPDEFQGSNAMVEIRRGPEDWRDQNGVRLADDYLFPVCSPSLSSDIKNLVDLERQNIIYVRPVIEGWWNWTQAVGISTLIPNQSHVTQEYATAYGLASKGAGVALGSKILCRDMIASNQLVVPLDLKVEAQSSFWSILRKPELEVAQIFHDWLIKLMTDEFSATH